MLQGAVYAISQESAKVCSTQYLTTTLQPALSVVSLYNLHR